MTCPDPHLRQTDQFIEPCGVESPHNGKIDYSLTTKKGQGFIYYENGDLDVVSDKTSKEVVGRKITEEKEPAKIICAENGGILLEAPNGTITIKAKNIRFIGVDGVEGEITFQASKIIRQAAPTITAQGANITIPHDQLFARYSNANVKLMGFVDGAVRHIIFGVITSFTETTTTIVIPTANLNTSYDNVSEWQIGITGQRGQAGATGATGPQGPGVQYSFSIAPFAYHGDNVSTSIFVSTGLSYMGGEGIYFQGGNENGYTNMAYNVNGYNQQTGEIYLSGVSSYSQGDLSGLQNLNATLIGRPGPQGQPGQTGASFIVSPTEPGNVAYGTVWIQA